MLGIRVGTTPLDVNARTTAADDCAEMPTGEQLDARFSVGVGAARAAVAVNRTERMVLKYILVKFSVESRGLSRARSSRTLIFIMV